MMKLVLSLAAAVLLIWPAPAHAATTVTLQVDPTSSSLAPQVGASESLSGTITLRVGSLPVGGSPTAFDVIGLALSASGGATIGLDPAIANPGLGVLQPSGSFLVPTLFVRIVQGSTLDLAIPDITGDVTFGAGGASVSRLDSTFGIDTQSPSGVVTVTIAAVPEPACAMLVASGLAALALRARREVGR
jgi:hypothetical protein